MYRDVCMCVQYVHTFVCVCVFLCDWGAVVAMKQKTLGLHSLDYPAISNSPQLLFRHPVVDMCHHTVRLPGL